VRRPDADDGQVGTDVCGLVLLHLISRTVPATGDGISVSTCRGDLEQRLVDLDGLADLLEPAGHGALGDALTERRQLDRGA